MSIGGSPVYQGGFAMDNDGNTYTSLNFTTVNLVDTSLTNVDPRPVKLIKHNSQGDFEWALQYGSSTGATGSISKIIEKNHHLVMAGYSGTNFFTNNQVNGVDYSYRYFIARFDENGQIINAVRMPGITHISLKDDGTICFVTMSNSATYLGDEMLNNSNILAYGEIDLNGVITWRNLMLDGLRPKSMVVKNNKMYFYCPTNTNQFWFDTNLYTSPNGTNYSCLAKIDLSTHSVDTVIEMTSNTITGMEGNSAPFLAVDDDDNLYITAQYNSSNSSNFLVSGTSLSMQPNKAYVLKFDNHLSLVSATNINQASNSTTVNLRQLEYYDNYLFASGKYNDTIRVVKYTTNLNEVSRLNFPTAQLPDVWDNGALVFGIAHDKMAIFRKQNICSNNFCGDFGISKVKTDHNVMQGRAYKDMDQNGVFSFGDIPIGGAVIQLLPQNKLICTNHLGFFNVSIDTGYYELVLGSVNSFFSQAPCVWTFLTPNQVQTQDLRLVPSPGGHDLQLDIVSFNLAAVGTTRTSKLILTNQGTHQEDALVKILPFSFSNQLIYNASFPYSNSGDTLIYNLISLNPEDTIELEISYTIPISLLNNLGEVDSSLVWIEGPIEDTIQNDSILTWTKVVAAYDPNYKECNLKDSIPFSTNLSKKFTYTIHFQNEGNYYAENILVKDSISQRFDLNTFRVLESSHDVYASFNENQLIFHFDNIDLNYETNNYEESKGFVTFTIELNSPLELDELLCNQAEIYFDLNPAIITNNNCVYTFEENISTVGIEEIDNQEYFIIYPNPSSNLFYITSTTNVDFNSILVYDELGRIVQINSDVIDGAQLSAGIYTVELLDTYGQSIYRSKIIKVDN